MREGVAQMSNKAWIYKLLQKSQRYCSDIQVERTQQSRRVEGQFSYYDEVDGYRSVFA